MRIFQYIDLVFSFVPVLVGWGRRRSFDRPLRLFLLRLAMASLADVISLVLGKLWIPNAPFVQSFHLVDNFLLLLIFSLVLRDLPHSGLILWVYPVYLAGFIIAKFTFEPITMPDQYTYSAMYVVLLGLSVLLLLRSLARGDADPASNPWTWISIGFTALFASNLALFSVLSWYVTLPYDEAVRIYAFHWIGNIVVNAIFVYGLLRVKEPWTTGG